MSVRNEPRQRAAYPQDSARSRHEEQLARCHILSRAYPLAKQLAEILELEAEDLAGDAKVLRRRIGSELAEAGDGR